MKKIHNGRCTILEKGHLFQGLLKEVEETVIKYGKMAEEFLEEEHRKNKGTPRERINTPEHEAAVRLVDLREWLTGGFQ